MEKKIFTVNGMRCEHCEARVNKALTALEGVASAKADHAKNQVEVEYDPAAVAIQEIADTIEDTGFECQL